MKIGIMTMHRVQNMGSVLQAYALQHIINQMGCESELIDYVFPPTSTKKPFSIRGKLSYMLDMLQGFPVKTRLRKLTDFRKEFLRCSKQTYTRESLLNNPPQYDIFCSGSDQVWNPLHVRKDTSFMLDFAPKDAPRIAYASSFAQKRIDEPFFSLYAQHLSRYNCITVRELSGVDIVKSMTGKDAPVVCDPTLLLTADEWNKIADSSKINIHGEYILVYLLSYMFNPRPGFYNIVETVRHALKIPVYHYNPYRVDSCQCHIKPLKGMGPADLVRLIRDASFVVTDSFHGAAFATIFNTPMIGVVKDNQNGDGRIATLRTKVESNGSIVCHNKPFEMNTEEIEKYKCNVKRVEEIRQYSTKELERMIDIIRKQEKIMD